jgi:hypothetical protein
MTMINRRPPAAAPTIEFTEARHAYAARRGCRSWLGVVD